MGCQIVDLYSAQDKGTRAEQEDSFANFSFLENGDHLEPFISVLADGMGGEMYGKLASELAVENFIGECYGKRSDTPESMLMDGVKVANTSIAEVDDQGRIGTTILGTYIVDGCLFWTSVGDSILYLCREGKMERLNQDHSMMPKLLEKLDAGEMTQEEVDSHPDRNVLRSALIGNELTLVDIGFKQLQAHDLIILATDGIEVLSNDYLLQTFLENSITLKEMVTRMFSKQAELGLQSMDNTTLTLMRIG